MSNAQFVGVGVGPGDPELITLKAMRLIQSADVISYIANDKGESQAKRIAVEALQTVTREQLEIPVVMPMCNDRSVANKVYDEAAASITEQIQAGKQVVFICEGDPLFFGSFAYLLERLQQQFECSVVPGISSVHAASSALQHPLTMLKESFAVISGRHSDEQMRAALQQHDSVVIMKAGQSRPRILAALKDCDRFEEARYLENIGRVNERMITDLSELEDTAGPYFSLFVITRSERDRT
ncbi:precorrin-2 C(20)-methyltransferase [Maricurvus nonylphenolicus]|uniref:precorrin-2 C(20)-methyltransferase n=1 Tax=Maricurvus nonylphenolicus TaxID=1008307 RepID=UPI0036F23294